MVAAILNPPPSPPIIRSLVSDHLLAFSDVDIVAAQVHFPSHRAVLAVHSLEFRHIFSTPTSISTSTQTPTPTPASAPSPSPTPLNYNNNNYNNNETRSTRHQTHPTSQSPQLPTVTSSTTPLQSPVSKFRIHLSVDGIPDDTLLNGWKLVYDYIYGAVVHLSTDSVLAALPICRRYRFDQLATTLDAYLADGAVDPRNSTRVFAAASRVATLGTGPADSQLVLTAAWNVLKTRFGEVCEWACMPYAALVKLLKLNDLAVESEFSVFQAVEEWVENNGGDEDTVAGLVKLVRFPTMTEDELERAAASVLVRGFPVCRKYLSRGFAARADEKRGLVRNVVMESSPVYRRRRTDALTFSDRVMGWARVERSVQTSSRYFAGCLWNLVLDVGEEWVGLHLGCLSENEEREMDVELDFSLFVVRHGGGDEPELIAKEVKRAGFGRSGQRIGFDHMIRKEEVEREGSRLLLRDTLFIGASLRLRHSKEEVVGISVENDDTAESVSRLG